MYVCMKILLSVTFGGRGEKQKDVFVSTPPKFSAVLLDSAVNTTPDLLYFDFRCGKKTNVEPVCF